MNLRIISLNHNLIRSLFNDIEHYLFSKYYLILTKHYFISSEYHRLVQIYKYETKSVDYLMILS